jgi:hypothetical protein
MTEQSTTDGTRSTGFASRSATSSQRVGAEEHEAEESGERAEPGEAGVEGHRLGTFLSPD